MTQSLSDQIMSSLGEVELNAVDLLEFINKFTDPYSGHYKQPSHGDVARYVMSLMEDEISRRDAVWKSVVEKLENSRDVYLELYLYADRDARERQSFESRSAEIKAEIIALAKST